LSNLPSPLTISDSHSNLLILLHHWAQKDSILETFKIRNFPTLGFWSHPARCCNGWEDQGWTLLLWVFLFIFAKIRIIIIIIPLFVFISILDVVLLFLLLIYELCYFFPYFMDGGVAKFEFIRWRWWRVMFWWEDEILTEFFPLHVFHFSLFTFCCYDSVF